MNAETKKSSEVEAKEPQTSEKENTEKPQPKAEVKTEKAGANNLRVLENIDVKLTVEVGNTEIKIRDLLRLNEGSVVELDRLAGEPLDILANGTMIAKGEVVMVGERFGIRLTEVVDPEERVQNL
ncbi:MAG: flagellar motor switch protein FliN [Rickettsiales bacterium]|nr:flagellar motor switch protein FliN [Rickettsiales bacterium]|tara:strand:+ start:117 stop:491 length:375 start_codon:yes stop_codon:yes gene_type:complete